MKAKAIVFIFALQCGLAGIAQAADFAQGLQAFDGGDYEQAAAHWRPLAGHGDALAQVALAELYLTGLGVKQDDRQAVELLRRAALQGHGLAQLNYADFAAEGRGRPRDPVVAYTWYVIASRQGVAVAEQRRRELRQRLSARDVAAAEATVRALKVAQ